MTDMVKPADKDNISDIPSGGWIDRLAPAIFRPYFRLARLDRPIGTWLLLLPCWWSIALAGPQWAEGLRLFVLFGIGSLVMRGAGCTLNDIVDRNFDAMVARTATRPIPAGEVSVFQAFAFLALQLLIGLVVLSQLNGFAITVGIGSLALVAVYPFMKRFTYWPQAVLGLTFNWGALLGWAAVKGELAPPALVLYGAGILWTLGYDTIYAHQDKDDDLAIGIKSTALRLGDETRPWLFLFYGATVSLIMISGYMISLAWPFYALLAAALAQLSWQAATVDMDTPGDCLAKFRSNRIFGLIVLAAIISGQAI